MGPAIGPGIHLGEPGVVPINPKALLVDLKHVIGVHEVLDQDLPVGRPHINRREDGDVVLHGIAADHVCQAGQLFGQRGWIGVLRHKNKPLPHLDRQLAKLVAGRVKR
jgi:hypothetical protein